MPVSDRISLCINGGFEAGDAAWTADGVTVTAQAEGADATSHGCLELVRDAEDDAGPGTLSQQASDLLGPAIAARGCTFGIRVASGTAGVLVPFVSADAGETRTYGTINTGTVGSGMTGGIIWTDDAGNPRYETLLVERFAVPEAPGEDDPPLQLVYGLEVRGNCTALVDNATLVLGSEAGEIAGCITPEILALLVSGAQEIPTPAPTRRKDRAPSSRHAATAPASARTGGSSPRAPEKPPEASPERSVGKLPESTPEASPERSVGKPPESSREAPPERSVGKA